jgi:hypothetical protein
MSLKLSSSRAEVFFGGNPPEQGAEGVPERESEHDFTAIHNGSEGQQCAEPDHVRSVAHDLSGGCNVSIRRASATGNV